jgi:hypothetical protein
VLEVEGEASEHCDVRLGVANSNPFDVLGAIIAYISRPHASSRVPSLRRSKEEGLDAWLARVRRMAVGEGGAGYRDGSTTIDVTTLTTTLEEGDASAEERAAAAHALLEIGTDDALTCVARVLVTRAVPPIVLVATHLARAGSAIVDAELFAEMIDFCSTDAADRSLPRRDDDDQARRLAAILARETAEAAAALEAAAAETRGRKNHSLPAGSQFESMRWIGRSWGL